MKNMGIFCLLMFNRNILFYRFCNKILPVLFPSLLPVASIMLTGDSPHHQLHLFPIFPLSSFLIPSSFSSFSSLHLLLLLLIVLSLLLLVLLLLLLVLLPHSPCSPSFAPNSARTPFSLPSASVYTVVCLSIERLLHLHRPQWSNKVPLV